MTTTTTRRAMLATAAALPALAASQALANFSSLAPDPIFAALEAYRRVHAEHRPGMTDEEADELADRWGDAQGVVMRTRPTTPAGLAALTGFARAEKIDQNCNDLGPLWSTLDDATHGMAGLRPWSTPRMIESKPDPIFAAIERHKAAIRAHEAAAEISGCLPPGDEFDAAEAVTDRAGAALDAAGIALADIQPTTMAGLLAMLGYVTDLATDDEFDGANPELPHHIPIDDDLHEHFVHYLLRSIAGTVRALADGGVA